MPDPFRHRHPWEEHPYFRHRQGPHAPRHWFFMRVLMFLFCCCLVVGAFFLLTGDLAPKRILHAIGIIFLVMFFGGLFLRRLFRPFRWLILGVREIGGGNLDFRFPIRHRHGEIWFLADQFNRMAERVQEMVKSKERLLVDVSHELRSPLTRLKVALAMTPKGKLKASMTRDIAEMEVMLGEILETEKLKSSHGKLDLKPLDLTQLVKELVSRYKDRRPSVKLMGKPTKTVVQADALRSETVLRNVLENALKYSAHQRKAVEVSLEKNGTGVEIRVRDHGRGIPKKEQERVFEPFYRVDPSRNKDTGGYGLGLSLCREIMRAHGGRIVLESGSGKGITVRIFWPSKPKAVPAGEIVRNH